MPRFDLTPYRGGVWRFVEDQNISSTMKLVDGLDEQMMLEELLDASKPPVPAPCQHLHYLQFTPFRYAARYATRFRPQGDRRGVFYAAETVQTAATEVAFYRALFFIESPETKAPENPFEMTAFCTKVRSAQALDIGAHFEGAALAAFAHPTDYAPCHALAEEVRGMNGEVIRFPSARDHAGTNVAVLSCAAFPDSQPRDMQGWWFRFSEFGLFATQRFGDGRLEFPFEMFENDPRISAAGRL